MQLGAGDGGGVCFDRALGFADQRLLGVQLLTGNQIAFDQLLVALQITTGVGQRRPIFRQLAFGLGEGDFKLAGVDFGEQIARFDLLAFGKVDGQKLTIDAAADGDGIGRRHGTEAGKIAGHRFAGGGCRLYRCEGGTKTTCPPAAMTLLARACRRRRAAICRVATLPEPVRGTRDDRDHQHGGPTAFIATFH